MTFFNWILFVFCAISPQMCFAGKCTHNGQRVFFFPAVFSIFNNMFAVQFFKMDFDGKTF